MHKKNLLFVYMIVLCLAGCARFTTHNTNLDFEGSLGKKKIITDSFLCKKGLKFFKGLKVITIEIWPTRGDDACPDWFEATITTLPKGTTINVTSVEEHKYWNLYVYQHWYYTGKVNFDGKEYEFYRFFGLTVNSPDFPERPREALWQ